MEFLEYTFFRNAILGILFNSICAAIIGTYIISRRMVAITGGITHACFGGLGLGYFLGFNPVVTASVFAVFSALGVEWMSLRHRVREDSAIAVIWAFGMAIGVLFVFLTPGYVPELNAFLFGNLLTITSADIIVFAIYTALLLLIYAVAFRMVVAAAFDRDFATVVGLPVKLLNTLMTVMVAIGVVLTIRMVGIMLLMSLFSLPQMIAETRCVRFRSMTVAAVAVSVVTCLSGLFVSAYIDVPCSAVIVIIQVLVFVVARILSPRKN